MLSTHVSLVLNVQNVIVLQYVSLFLVFQSMVP